MIESIQKSPLVMASHSKVTGSGAQGYQRWTTTGNTEGLRASTIEIVIF
jgi:hypothetical protein